AIHDAFMHNTAVAIAAGNDQLFVNQYSLSTIQQDALVVGAVGPDGSVAGYSDGATIYAPGGTGSGDQHSQITSTYVGSAYAYGSGTSFSTPQVAGVLAQLMAKGFSASNAYGQIRNNAVNRSGVPELDAAAALGASGTCGAQQSAGGGSAGHSGSSGSHSPSSTTPTPTPPTPRASPRTSTASHSADTLTPVGGGGNSGSTSLNPLATGIALGGVAALVGGAVFVRRRFFSPSR
ncbi:MAG: S8 family serine peptidase, partial [Candidatus Dormibacteraeota bacterium]|nr:S8 family serine peptidase [Candidatus Dormibacteraeota bacterium]